MSEQTRATSAAATATASTAADTARTQAAGHATSTVAPPEDAWDRLAALAFGSASVGGCSEHAHACACLAEHGVDHLAYLNPESETVD